MKRTWLSATPLILTMALAGWPLPGAAAAQEHAMARLFVRPGEGEVRAVVLINIHPDRHLYHSDIGGDLDEFGNRYPGKPLRVTPSGDDIQWAAPRIPSPQRYEDLKLGNWANVHQGTILVFLAGRLQPGARADDIEVRVSGLTCSEVDLTCVPLRQVLKPEGPGPDAAFAHFPGDLL